MSEETIIKVLIVDDIADTCDQIEKLLFFEKDIKVVGKASNGRQAIEMALKLQPNVILMDINMPEMDGIAATEAISAKGLPIGVIIMSVQGETDYLRRAMFAGAMEFLVKPVPSDDLFNAIRSVYARVIVKPARGPAVSASENQPPKSDAKGHLLAVFSPKGGVGTSSVAANLAIALRQLTNKKVVLVDGNLVLGDIGVILDLKSADRTIAELAENITEMDRELLNEVLANHSSQIKVLVAPPNPQIGETVTAEHFRRILEFLCAEFDYVVVDTPCSFQDRALTALDMADRIVLLMALEMTCIKNIKLFLEVAELLEYQREKIFLVLNKADSRPGIKVADIEANIQHKVALQIGNAPLEMTNAINQGVPMVIDKRDHRTSKDIFSLAKQLATMSGENVGDETAAKSQAAAKNEKKSGGLFGMFQGR